MSGSGCDGAQHMVGSSKGAGADQGLRCRQCCEERSESEHGASNLRLRG